MPLTRHSFTGVKMSDVNRAIGIQGRQAIPLSLQTLRRKDIGLVDWYAVGIKLLEQPTELGSSDQDLATHDGAQLRVDLPQFLANWFQALRLVVEEIPAVLTNGGSESFTERGEIVFRDWFGRHTY